MPFDNTTLLSYGKNSQSKTRNHTKTRYYIERSVVSYKPLAPEIASLADEPCKPVPLIPNLSQIHKQSILQKNSIRYSHTSRSKLSGSNNNSAIKDSHLNNFEKKYYIEVEKNKNLLNQMNQFKQVNNQLVEDKDAIKGHYEAFIKRIQNDFDSVKGFEGKYNAVDLQRRKLEEEVEKLRIELSLLKEEKNGAEGGTIDELRQRIQKLNKEKMELMNSLKLNKTEINNLRIEVRNCKESGRNKEQLLMDDVEKFKSLIQAKELRITELLNRFDSDRDNVNNNKALNVRLFDFEKENINLKNQLRNKEDFIVSLQKKIRELEENKRYTPVTTIVNQSPYTERKSVVKEPYRNSYKVGRTSIVRTPTVQNIPFQSHSYRNVETSPTIIRATTKSNLPVTSRIVTQQKRSCGCCQLCPACNSNNRSPHHSPDKRQSRRISILEDRTPFAERMSHTNVRYTNRDFSLNRTSHKPFTNTTNPLNVRRVSVNRNSVTNLRRESSPTNPIVTSTTRQSIQIEPIKRNSIIRRNTFGLDVRESGEDQDKTAVTLEKKERDKSIELYKYHESPNPSINQSEVFQERKDEQPTYNVFQNSVISNVPENKENFSEYQYFEESF